MSTSKQPIRLWALALTSGLVALSALLVGCGAASGTTVATQGTTPVTLATITLTPTVTPTATANRTPRPTPTNTPRPRPTPTKTPKPTATPTPAPANVHVNIVTSGPNPYGFSPGSITIAKGTKVIWTNMTSAPHTATSNAGDPVAFDSGTQLYSQNSTFSFTFTVSGTYTYHCTVHSYMTATVIVTG